MFAPRDKIFGTLSGVVSATGGTVCAQCLLAAVILTLCSEPSRAWETWRFIATCDSRGSDDGIQKTILSELVSEILENEVDFVLFPGDLVSGGSTTPTADFEAKLRVWVEIMEPVYDESIGVYVCRGNHEIADAWGQAAYNLDPNDNFALRWLEVFGNSLHPQWRLPGNGPSGEKYMTYSVVHKNAFIVLTDQYAGLEHRSAHEVSQPWFDAQLSANMQPHVFVAGHEPAFSALHADCLDDNPAERDAFWAAIRDAGGRTYFCGHDHFYDHARIDDGDGNPENDVHQYISGAAGAPPYSWSPPYLGDNGSYEIEQLYHAEGYGYTLVEIDGPKVTLIWMERHTRDLDVPGIYEPRETWSYTVTPELRVLSPNRNDRVVSAKSHTIRWKTFGAEVDSVTIDYSTDNGQTWHQLAQWPNTGSYEWDPVPAVNSTQCLVRVTDVRDSSLSDTTDESFAIFECHRRMRGDLNGDCYVDFLDLAVLVGEWLECGNPFDPSCH